MEIDVLGIFSLPGLLKYRPLPCQNVQFQKISIPTPWKVNGNSEGVGGLKSQNFKSKV